MQLITALIAYLLIRYAHRVTFGRLSALRWRQLLRASLWQHRSLAGLFPPARTQPTATPHLWLMPSLP